MLERKSPFVCSVNGAKEISIENYGSLGDFSDKKIVLNCYKCKMIIEGEGLLIESSSPFKNELNEDYRSYSFNSFLKGEEDALFVISFSVGILPDCFKWDESGTFFKSLRSKADSFVEY